MINLPSQDLRTAILGGSFLHCSLYFLRVEAVSKTSQEVMLSSAFSRACLLAEVQTGSIPHHYSP